MMARQKQRFAAALAVMCMLAAACADADLKTVASELVKVKGVLAEMQQIAIDANTGKVLSDSSTRTFMEFAIKTNEAGLRATSITRNLNSLAPQDRQNLLQIMQPVIASLIDMQKSVDGVPNEGVRAKIQATLALIQASLNVMQTSLAVRSK